MDTILETADVLDSNARGILQSANTSKAVDSAQPADSGGGTAQPAQPADPGTAQPANPGGGTADPVDPYPGGPPVDHVDPSPEIMALPEQAAPDSVIPGEGPVGLLLPDHSTNSALDLYVDTGFL